MSEERGERGRKRRERRRRAENEMSLKTLLLWKICILLCLRGSLPFVGVLGCAKDVIVDTVSQVYKDKNIVR